MLKRNQNTHLMFVRAPKHFKSGKQIIVFFNGIYRRRFMLSLNYTSSWAYSGNQQAIFKILNSLYRQTLSNEIITSRITLETDFFFSINGGYNFYSINY